LSSHALYRGTSLIKNNPLLGHCSRTMTRAIWWPLGVGVLPMSEVSLWTPLAGSSGSGGSTGTTRWTTTLHRKSTCLAQSTLGSHVVQIWSRNTSESGPNETFVVHRVVPCTQQGPNVGVCHRCFFALTRSCDLRAVGRASSVQGYLAHKKAPTPLGLL
jgi:hypothetical protein